MKPDPASLLAPPAQLAKAALRRLALDKLEPTPDNFARAYAQEAGIPPSASASLSQTSVAPLAWADLIERLARGLERGGHNWTGARKMQILQRVLDGSRNDVARLHERLDRLIASWDGDSPDAEIEPSAPMPLGNVVASAGAEEAPVRRVTNVGAWNDMVADYSATV